MPNKKAPKSIEVFVVNGRVKAGMQATFNDGFSVAVKRNGEMLTESMNLYSGTPKIIDRTVVPGTTYEVIDIDNPDIVYAKHTVSGVSKNQNMVGR